MKTLFNASILSLALLMSGCGTFRVSTTQIRNYSLDDITKMISAHENHGTTPEYLSIGEVYAMRSACHAHHNPTFKATYTCVGLGIEGGFRHGIPFLLASPLAPIFDICALPVQAIRTLGVSDVEMRDALQDLAKARSLGHTNDAILVEYFIRNSTHLDRLGYKLENYTQENPEPSTEGDGLRPAP